MHFVFNGIVRRRRIKTRQPIEFQTILTTKGITNKIKDLVPLYRVQREWEEIVGPALAQWTLACRIEKTRLVIKVENPTWAQHLGFVKIDILKKLEQKVSLVFSDLQFEVGVIPIKETLVSVAPRAADYKLRRKDATPEETLPDILSRVRAKMRGLSPRQNAKEAVQEEFCFGNLENRQHSEIDWDGQ